MPYESSKGKCVRHPLYQQRHDAFFALYDKLNIYQQAVLLDKLRDMLFAYERGRWQAHPLEEMEAEVRILGGR